MNFNRDVWHSKLHVSSSIPQNGYIVFLHRTFESLAYAFIGMGKEPLGTIVKLHGGQLEERGLQRCKVTYAEDFQPSP
jgi:hypothetical protein